MKTSRFRGRVKKTANEIKMPRKMHFDFNREIKMQKTKLK